MFDFLRGVVFKKYLDSISLLTGGIGFKVHVPTHTLNEVEEGEEVGLFVEPVFPPEGTPILYGFKTLEEREIFRELLKIPKVGSKIALSVLSTFSPEELYEIFKTRDVELLSSVPGLGKKLSARIINELSGKFEGEVSIPVEVYEVLLSLGYKKGEILSSLKGINLRGMRTEDAVKEALKHLSGNRG
ncbi:Holliday junction DNA helicase subunit RuvA [Balnearium lithotrophicum]|uniref:Holliday junction branch migration complex subunit RuvA n=1 Tax=Balnearium lithotrophicum TaxID=223788 RepID=A0A521CGM6_9BACT|nr:Holliday junction branch migration protein RuvA [Balnearium lithotrophicum]SMO58597.1 Holliday junction DNA helicase subunit RuvA [Balnearium lithotrophicum]